MAITLVEQDYKSTKEWQEYKTGLGTIYGGWRIPMDIGKSKENFKDKNPRYFNCNIYRHMAKDYKRPKRGKDTRKCYKYRHKRHIAKDYRIGQKIKELKCTRHRHRE